MFFLQSIHIFTKMGQFRNKSSFSPLFSLCIYIFSSPRFSPFSVTSFIYLVSTSLSTKRFSLPRSNGTAVSIRTSMVLFSEWSHPHLTSFCSSVLAISFWLCWTLYCIRFAPPPPTRTPTNPTVWLSCRQVNPVRIKLQYITIELFKKFTIISNM